MQYSEFITQVQQRGQFATQEDALRATHATLVTLAERLVGGEAHDLFAQLPAEITHTIHPLQEIGPSTGFGVEEFLRRVGARTGVDAMTARQQAQAVLLVVQEAISPGELADVRAQLPAEIYALFDDGASS